VKKTTYGFSRHFLVSTTMISNRPDRRRHLLDELDEMEARIKEVSGVMVDGSRENGERSSSAVKELEMVTERLGEGLDRLGNGVNEIFNSVLSTRKGMLEKMRVGPPQEKRSDAKEVTSNLYTKQERTQCVTNCEQPLQEFKLDLLRTRRDGLSTLIKLLKTPENPSLHQLMNGCSN